MKKIALFLVVLISVVESYSQTKEPMKEFDSNFAHTVYFWLKHPESEQDKTSFVTSLKKFLNTSKYAKTNFIGYPPKASRDVVDGSFTFSLIVTFESAAAQESYQKEEAHLLFIEESNSLWTKVIVYDSVLVP